VYFGVTGQLLITYSALVKCLKKWRYNVAVHQLFIAFKQTLTQIEGRYCITEFGIPMKLVWLIKMCLNENNRVRVDKNLSDVFPVKRCFIASSCKIFSKICH
jgi:hypothetical protein